MTLMGVLLISICFNAADVRADWYNVTGDFEILLYNNDALADPFLAGDKCWTINGNDDICIYCDATADRIRGNNATMDHAYCCNAAGDMVETHISTPDGLFDISGYAFGSDEWLRVLHFDNTSGIDAAEVPNPVTKGGAPAARDGVVGGAVHFDGVDDQFSYGNMDDGDPMAIMMFIKPGNADNRYIFGNWNSDPRYHMEIDGGKYNLRWRDNSGPDYVYSQSLSTATSDIWSHVAGNFSGTTSAVMINGSYESHGADAGMGYTTGGNIDRVGTTDGNNFGNFTIDELWFKNTTMTEAVNYAHYCNLVGDCNYSYAGTPTTYTAPVPPQAHKWTPIINIEDAWTGIKEFITWCFNC
jgi:hypothetical protein